MKWFASASLALLLVAPMARAEEKDKIKDNPYYPLQLGNTWTYKAGETQEFTLKVVKYELVDKEWCARIEMTSVGDADKRLMAVEHVCVKDDGVYRYQFGDKKPDKPVCILKFPLKKGGTWDVDTKALGEPLKGTFRLEEGVFKLGGVEHKAFIASSEDLDAAGMKLNCAFTYAENVGLAKQVIKTGGQEITVELKKFEAGTPKK